MPTIDGSKSGTRPYLQLDWSVNSQDIANNRSSVKLKLYLKVDYSIGYSARYTGTLQGASFTSSSGYISSPGKYLLTERDVWIGHNSDGSKTANLTADYNLNISWGGSYHGKITLSGNADLGTIPRASTLSAFSFASHLKPNTEVNLNYTIDRKSSSFRHHIELKDGSHLVQEWGSVDSNGVTSVKLSTTSVNNLLNRMSSVTSRSLTLRITTWSGANRIGSAVSRNATATVHEDVKPSVGTVTVSQTGNSVSTHYLQNKSKIKGEFTGSAGYGASITSSGIMVRKKTANTDAQTISGLKGTTARAVRLNGVYEAQGRITDSRGRSNWTSYADFIVTEYESPRITGFGAYRLSATPTTVSISRAATQTRLDGHNVLTYTVQRKQGTGEWTNVNTNATGTSTAASFTGSSTSTGNSITSSYDFRMVITDSFGEKAESVVSVTTQRVVLDVHKNEGVGIGKIHEKGVLDVDGGAHFKGDLFVNNVNMTHAQNFADVKNQFTVADTAAFWYSLPQGTYYVGTGEIPNQPTTYGFMVHSKRPTSYDFNTIWYQQAGGQVYRKSGNYSYNHAWTVMNQPESGSNEHGTWTKYWDGTMIQTARSGRNVSFPSTFNGMNHSASVRIPFPQQFVGTPIAMTSIERGNAGVLLFSPVYGPSSTESPQVQVFANTSASKTIYVTCVAIGRWK